MESTTENGSIAAGVSTEQSSVIDNVTLTEDRNSATLSESALKDKISDAQVTLERVNGWISNCDAKVATVLGLIGVILTIVLTNDGLTAIWIIIKTAVGNKMFSDLLYLFVWGVSFVALCVGMYFLIKAVVASIHASAYEQPGLVTHSKIFFGSIASYSSFEQYRSDYKEISVSEELDDLLSQIYINSCIAKAKHENYNRGLKLSIIGFVVFVVLFLVGIYLYLSS